MDWNEAYNWVIQNYQSLIDSNLITIFCLFILTFIFYLFKEEIKKHKKGLTSPQSSVTNPINIQVNKTVNEELKVVPVEEQKIKKHNNVPSSSNYFTGRFDVLNSLFKEDKKQEKSLICQVIYGPGGVGKSEIAKKYANDNKDKYNHLFWINAENTITIEENFYNIVNDLNINTVEKDFSEITNEIKNWLYNNSKWLIIFDNAENENFIKKYLPNGNGHIIITSRNSNWSGINSFYIDVLKKEEAVDFLANKINLDKHQNIKDLNNLAEILGFLPLALEQAGAFIKSKNINISEYINDFKEKNTTIFKEDKVQPCNTNIATTWQISFEKIKIEKPESIDFLNIIAFLSSDNINTIWFKDNFTNIDDIINILKRFSLIKQSTHNISIHRLVQMVIKDSIIDKTTQKEQIETAINLISKIFKFEPDKIKTWKNTSSFIPHVESLKEYIEQFDIQTEQAAYIINEAGSYYNAQGNYKKAFNFYNRALIIKEKILSNDNHPSIAESYSNIGNTYYARGNYNEALEYYNKTLGIREKILGENHQLTAVSYNNIGSIYKAQGQYEKALNIFFKAYDLLKKILGESHFSIVVSYENIGSVYNVQGQYEKALNFYFKALDLKEKELGINHPDTAATYNNIGSIYNTIGKYKDALDFYFKALDIRENVLGLNHPSIVTSYNNIAHVYDNQGNHKQSFKLYSKAYEKLKKKFGKNHPNTLSVKENIEHFNKKHK